MPDDTDPICGEDICRAEFADLEKILELQYIAYQSEAKLLNNPAIPPLQEKLSDLENQFREMVFLKVVDESGTIVGSVRGRVENGTLHIGKLMVHPGWQGKGLGSRLLAEIENRCPQPRFELFTSDKSGMNLLLYNRMGYSRFQERENGPELRFVYLEKVKAP